MIESILCFMTDHLPARLRFLTLILHAAAHRHHFLNTLIHPYDAELTLDDCDRCADEMR